MPAPDASFILSMLNPYKGFDPNESAKAAVAAGQLGESRAGRRQKAEQFGLENERADSYLALQQDQFKARESNELRDKQIAAYTKFQAAVDSGDTEQADLALGELSMLGVGVEKYGGQSGASGMGSKAKPASPLGAYAPPGVAAQAPSAPAKPMSKADAATDQALDKLARDATVDDGAPSAGHSMDAMAPPGMARPGPSRAAGAGMPAAKRPGSHEAALEAAGKMTTPTSWAEQVGPDQWEARGGDDMGNPIEPGGPRPSPARTPFIKGDEPAPAGEASPDQPIIHGYRLKFGDKVIDVNPDSIAERQRGRVAAVFQPLIDSAATPEEKRAAVQAKHAAVQMVGTVKPEQAVAAGLDFYTGNLDRQAREKRAGIISGKVSGGHGGVDTSKAEQKRSLDAAKFVESVVNKEQAEHNIKGIREEIAKGNDALSKANSPDGLGQFASKATLQKQLYVGSLSNKDIERLETATGMYNRMVQWVNNWSGDGQVPPDVLNAIKRIVVEKNKILRERLMEAGKRAEGAVRGNPFLPKFATQDEIDKSADQAFEQTTGMKKPETKRARGTTEAGGPATGGKPKKAAGGGANAAARRLLGR